MTTRNGDSRSNFAWQLPSLVVGVVAAIVAIIVALIGDVQFFQSYLMAYLFWLGLSLGAFVMLLAQHMAGGSWGAVIRRPLEAAVSVLPVLAILFLPILFGMQALYIWTDPEYVAQTPIVAAKTAYLNVPFFIVRAVIYFAIWLGGAWWYLRMARRQDADPRNAGVLGFRMRSFAGAWMILYVLTVTFAAFDWGMSITPDWFSGIYPTIHMAGQAISGIAFVIIAMVFLARRDDGVNELLTTKRLQDLGNFLMAFLMFWAYVSFSQLIIIWSNNIVETNTWYVARLNTDWVALGVFLLVFGFFAPFLILFSRWVKRKRTALVTVAAFSLLVRLLDLVWILMPSFGREGAWIHVMDVLLIIAVGGIWLSLFARSLAAQPLIPLHDPRLVAPPHDDGHAPAAREVPGHA